MKRKVTVVLLALVAALLLGLSVFFVACDVGTDNEEQSGHTHTMTYIAAEEATCTEEGNVAYWYCSGCGKNFSDEAGENELTSVTVPAKNHSFGEWVDNEDGTHIHSCSICGTDETASHIYDEETNSYCTVCDFFSDYTQGLAYSYADGGYTVTGIGTATASKVIIPATYNDGVNGSAVVTGIGSSAFYGCSSLTGITIPASVASIGDEAFYRCSNLTEINYNAAAVADLRYSSNVFYNAGSNSDGITVIFGESVTSVPDYLFYAGPSYAPNLISVTIGSSVESIGSDAFAYCSNLTEINYNAAAVADLTWNSSVFFNAGSDSDGVTVTFGESVTSIPAYLFARANIISVTIGSNVESIGSSAFEDCSGLTEITIPEGVTSIGSSAFSGCSGLTEINFNAAAIADCNSSVFNGAGSNSDGITVVFGENVTSIPAQLFSDENITSVTIGAGVTSIGYGAFHGCSNLTEINYNAASVADLSYDRNVFYNAGSNSDGITVTFGESVKSIPAYLFCAYSHYDHDYYSANIVNVTIGSNVESIGSYAFAYCSGLTEVTIGAGVTSIGSYAFRDCSNLTEINYNAAVVADLTSSSNVFYNVGSNSDGITVTFGESVTSIPAYLFYTYTSYVPNLVSVTIGSNVERIGSSAFRDCSNLAEITISEGVTSIGSNAFRGCSNFAEITIPASVTSIGSYAFAYCSNLMKINYNAADVADWTSASNVFRGAGSNSGGIAVTFGESVTSIPAFLFYDSSHLVNVTIGSNVESIGDSAFRGCSSLTEVTIPKGVTSIGNNAFCECSNLASVTIPDSVTIIGIWAFAFCSKLTSVTFEITEGWWRSTDSTAPSGTEIASSDLANPSTAATYLKSTYIGSYWRRS